VIYNIYGEQPDRVAGLILTESTVCSTTEQYRRVGIFDLDKYLYGEETPLTLRREESVPFFKMLTDPHKQSIITIV
jgi:hypothetical protein